MDEVHWTYDNAPLFAALLSRHAYLLSTVLVVVVVFSSTSDMCPLVALISRG